MSQSFVKRLGFAAMVVGAAAVVTAPPADARPSRRGTRSAASSAFNLFASTTLGFEINRVYCGLRAIGETCVDITGSPVLGGGSWPRGSGDQYIFNSGLQIAGIISSADPNFAWAGDTVGSWFMDPSGQQQSGEGITDIYSTLNPDDVANWPSAATIKDTSLYDSVLIGRTAISQQDIWWRYWDGNPNQITGRPHPAGILVEQRGLGWNFPSGNEDLVYFIYRFINVTASDPSKYSGLSAFGYTPGEIADIAAVGARFQQINEAKFQVAIPDTGYSIEQTYAAFFMDPDVGDFLTNYSTAFLPFAMAAAYVGDWQEPNWQFPSNIFSPPFAVAPGFVGVKYLKSPINPATNTEFGISIFSNTSNGPPFDDATGIQQMYRYLSGTVSTALGDPSCTVSNPQARHLCALVQQQTDTRFFQSSGPFRLDPGQSEVIVVAYVFAAAVAAPIQPFIGGNLPPGIPPSGTRLFAGLDTLRVVDRAAGWVAHADTSQDNEITQDEVTVVDRSLLSKSLVAQAVFDNKFLLPFAPEPPDFFVVPGDGQVTVVWQRSASETTGDPYYAVASQPGALNDPNYREFDVEGYRVWRGRTPSQMEVIAQFDYATTAFPDNNGTVHNNSYGTQCAPEAVPPLTTSCPSFPNNVPIVTQIGVQPGLVQVVPGGRVVSSGNVVFTPGGLDTAVSGGTHCGGRRCPDLADTGIPFAFTDTTVRNGFRYYYAVTAFDVNSVKSTGAGNTSLESPLVTKPAGGVVPRAGSGQEVVGALASLQLLGADGTALDPNAPLPSLDPTTGIFSGPMPPTNGFDLGFVSFLPQLLGSGDVTVTVDSIIPGSALDAANGGFDPFRSTVYWFTGQGSGAPVQFNVSFLLHHNVNDTEGSSPFPATTLSTAQAARFGGDSTYSLFGSVALEAPGAWRLTMKGRADANGLPVGPSNGPRWWEGAANENTDDPNGINCTTVTGSFTCALADLSRNAGAISGVGIFNIQSYTTIGSTSPARGIEGVTSSVMRAADFQVYWGANGAIDSVIDVTHRVPVPFSTKVRASWGILNDSSFVSTTAASTADGNNGLLTWSDFACVDPIPTYANRCGGAAQTPAVLMNHARLSPVAFTSSTYAGTSGLTTTGNGFILYLNGHFFLMQMAALPAAGTVWNARFYAGNIAGAVGSYSFEDAIRPPAVPGLRARISYTGSTFDPTVTSASQLARVHTVPDPYYVTNSLEITSTSKVLRFVNLPSQAIIRIYSTSGVLVAIVTHNDPTGGGDATWNLRNRNNQFVASGVYFYHVETPDGKEKVGRFTVVNFAQ
jgi:hypothetical protein